MNILVLTRYGRLGASSRLRFLQFLPELEREGLHCTVQAFIDDEMLLTKYRRGTYRPGQLLRAYAARLRQLLRRQRFDLVWIEKEALPWMPAWLERLLLRHTSYVLDYDDAIFHNYDRNAHVLVRMLWAGRIDRLMAGARLVVGGNEYLAARACEAGAPWVEVLPTVIDLERYAAPSGGSEANPVPRIVWIGSPGTVPYVARLAEPLAALAWRHRFVLRIVGGQLALPGVDVECLDWTEDSEVARITECEVGIMPLSDSPWERGKCGYKLIQYMACGLPVVASPVGVNRDIVREGESGFLAQEPADWVDRLGRLLDDAQLRHTMGRRGRQRVEQDYCVQQVAPRLIRLLRDAGSRPSWQC